MDFVPQSQHPSVSSRTPNVIPNAALLRTHLLQRMIRDLIIVPQNRSFQASLSGHPPRRRKLLLRWTAPQALQSLPLVKVLRVYKIQRKTASNIKNRIKDFLPKTENQFSSCALSQEEVDLQEYHVGAKDLFHYKNVYP